MFKWIWNEDKQSYEASHNRSIRADKEGNVFGGGSTNIETPSTPPQPSGAEAVTEWAKQLPSIYQTQLQYEPQLLQQQLAMQQQYAQPLLEQYLTGQERYGSEMAKQQMELQKQYGPQLLQQEYEAQLKYGPALTQAQYEISKQLYPETVGLQEGLAEQAAAGMQAGVPDWAREQYQSDLRANIGTNIGSGIGADYVSRGLLEQSKGWGDYYRNLALSVTGRQPLTQPATVATPQIQQPQYNMPQYQGTGWTQSWTPNTTWGNMNQGYGSYIGAYSSMYNSNAQMAMQKQMMPFYYMTAAGNMMRGAGSMMQPPGGQG